MFIFFKKFYFILNCITISEKKELNKKIAYLKFFIKNINIFKYIIFLFNRNQINPIKIKGFNKYIKENKKKWTKLNKFNKNFLENLFVKYIFSLGFIRCPYPIVGNPN